MGIFLVKNAHSSAFFANFYFVSFVAFYHINAIAGMQNNLSDQVVENKPANKHKLKFLKNKKAERNSEDSEDKTDGSHFTKVTHRCKKEGEEGPDTSPQSPPLVIDDPGTPGCGQWEINVTFDIDSAKGEKHIEAPLLDINYGIGDNLQLKFEVPNQLDQLEKGTESGLGNGKLGVKYLFYSNPKTNIEVAFYPQVEIPTSHSEPGHEINLPLLLTKKIGETYLGDVIWAVNLGYNLTQNADAKNFISVASAIGAPLSKKLFIMGELASEQALGSLPNQEREALIVFNVGLKRSLGDKYSLYGSLGASLLAADKNQHIYAVAGLQWTP